MGPSPYGTPRRAHATAGTPLSLRAAERLSPVSDRCGVRSGHAISRDCVCAQRPPRRGSARPSPLVARGRE
eukprot:6838346-Prymnesium_polylepis.1